MEAPVPGWGCLDSHRTDRRILIAETQQKIFHRIVRRCIDRRRPRVETDQIGRDLQRHHDITAGNRLDDRVVLLFNLRLGAGGRRQLGQHGGDDDHNQSQCRFDAHHPAEAAGQIFVLPIRVCVARTEQKRVRGGRREQGQQEDNLDDEDQAPVRIDETADIGDLNQRREQSGGEYHWHRRRRHDRETPDRFDAGLWPVFQGQDQARQTADPDRDQREVQGIEQRAPDPAGADRCAVRDGRRRGQPGQRQHRQQTQQHPRVNASRPDQASAECQRRRDQRVPALLQPETVARVEQHVAKESDVAQAQRSRDRLVGRPRNRDHQRSRHQRKQRRQRRRSQQPTDQHRADKQHQRGETNRFRHRIRGNRRSGTVEVNGDAAARRRGAVLVQHREDVRAGPRVTVNLGQRFPDDGIDPGLEFEHADTHLGWDFVRELGLADVAPLCRAVEHLYGAVCALQLFGHEQRHPGR